MNGTGRGGKGRYEYQPGGITCIGSPITLIDLLHLCITTVGNVMGDGFAQGRIDRAHFGGDFIQIEIQIIGMDQINVGRLFTVPEIGYHHLHQTNDTPSLLEALVLLELADKFPQVRMERIRIKDPRKKGLR